MRNLQFIIILVALALSACGGAAEDITLPLEISAGEAFDLYQNGTFFLDVRTQEEWNKFHAPNSTLIPLNQLEDRLDDLPDDQPIVVVCHSGSRSAVGRQILIEAGFPQVASLEGGLSEWVASGYPIETGP